MASSSSAVGVRVFRPQLTEEQKLLVFASYAASEYPGGLSQEAEPAHEADPQPLGERWVRAVHAQPDQNGSVESRKQLGRKRGRKPAKTRLAAVDVQDFFTKEPIGAFCRVQVHDVVLMEVLEEHGYPPAALVTDIWHGPRGAQLEIVWLYRLWELPEDVHREMSRAFPPPSGHRCTVKHDKEDNLRPEVGCTRELLYSDHVDSKNAAQVVHTIRVWFLDQERVNPHQEVMVQDGSTVVQVALPGHVCRQVYLHTARKVYNLLDSRLPQAIRQTTKGLVQRSYEALHDITKNAPFPIDSRHIVNDPKYWDVD